MIRQRPCANPTCERPIFYSDKQQGRPRTYCDSRCRREAYDDRRAAERGAVPIKYVDRPLPVEEHVAAVLASPAACRRVVRALGERWRSRDLLEARWISVADELERQNRLWLDQHRRWR